MRADARSRSALRYVIFGGEALDCAGSRRGSSATATSGPQLVNMYGITETTVHVTYRRITRADDDAAAGARSACRSPICRSTCSTAAASPVPVGVLGEICVGGAGVARRLPQPARAHAARFIPNPFGPARERTPLPQRRSRAAAARRQLEYLGRIDDQVKIRGFRDRARRDRGGAAKHAGRSRERSSSAENERRGDAAHRLLDPRAGTASRAPDDSACASRRDACRST